MGKKPRNPALEMLRAMYAGGHNEDTLDIESFYAAATELEKPATEPLTCVVCTGPLGDEPGARCTDCREQGKIPAVPMRPHRRHQHDEQPLPFWYWWGLALSIASIIVCLVVTELRRP